MAGNEGSVRLEGSMEKETPVTQSGESQGEGAEAPQDAGGTAGLFCCRKTQRPHWRSTAASPTQNKTVSLPSSL